jgi:hypothetical protein
MANGIEKVYEQYWLHARHQENQRLWFTNIYAVIVAGILAYLGAIYKLGNGNNSTFFISAIILFIFLTILSIFGYLITLAWNIPFVIYSRLAEEISIKKWNLDPEFRRFTKYKKGYNFNKPRWMRASDIFVAFYSLMTGVSISFFSYLFFNLDRVYVSLILIIIWISMCFIYTHIYTPKTVDSIIEDFQKRIKEYNDKSKSN